LPELIEALGALYGARCTTNRATLAHHAHSTTWLANEPPDAVVFPGSVEEVVRTVRLCASFEVPIIPFGTGSSLEGHVNAPHGGISVDLSGMKRILAINPEDQDCIIEPGVTRKELNAALRDHGLFFPVDPGADASLGGMAATRASGTNAVRYGTMKDNVIALSAVLASGETIRTARRARKTAAGYDLTRLFVGSEGTLGIITELTLKLHPLPEAVRAGMCSFPSLRAAAEATILAIQSGIAPARIELLCQTQISACNAYSKRNLPILPHLFLEFSGTAASVAEALARFGEISREFGAGEFATAERPEDRTMLWQARHDAYWAALALRPGAKGISTDVCVPISRLADCLEETIADLDESGLIAPIVGHVGDGNFHALLLVDLEKAEEVRAARDVLSRLNARALRMEGTCTGEHGIGQGKIAYLEAELGPEAIGVMRAIKHALDPCNLFNPGKIFSDGITTGR
jgi:D-lactate dehydrogenase (cytochrome)